MYRHNDVSLASYIDQVEHVQCYAVTVVSFVKEQGGHIMNP